MSNIWRLLALQLSTEYAALIISDKEWGGLYRFVAMMVSLVNALYLAWFIRANLSAELLVLMTCQLDAMFVLFKAVINHIIEDIVPLFYSPLISFMEIVWQLSWLMIVAYEMSSLSARGRLEIKISLIWHFILLYHFFAFFISIGLCLLQVTGLNCDRHMMTLIMKGLLDPTSWTSCVLFTSHTPSCYVTVGALRKR